MYDNFVVDAVDATFYYILIFSLFFLVAITITMIYFVWRFHHRHNPIASDIRGNLKLELAWIIIPSIIAFTMFLYGWRSYLDLTSVPKDALFIRTQAQMYSWTFTYPSGKESYNELLVPVGGAVKLQVTSNDVIHGFYLPAFRVKIDAVPGKNNYAWFLASRPGKYDIMCSSYCGVGHATMHGTLSVVSSEEFAAFLRGDESSPPAPAEPIEPMDHDDHSHHSD